MKQKRRISLILALILTLSLVLSACGPNTADTEGSSSTPTPTGSVKYQVTVLNPKGEPFADSVAVRFLRNGEQVGMQVADANGIASKELERGDYTIELKFLDSSSDYEYVGADVTLTATKTELTVQVYNNVRYSRPYQLNVKLDDSGNTYSRIAYDVLEGASRVKLTAGQRNFFVFTPERGGIYEFRIEGGQMVGNYGGVHYSYSNSTHLERESDKAFTFEVKDSSIGGQAQTGAAQLLIGIDAGSDTSATLTITRVGNQLPGLPYESYPTTTVLKEYKHPTGAQTKNIIVTNPTDAYNLVYNEEDGYYHLDSKDGPLVLMRVGKGADGENCPYMSSLETMVQAVALVEIVYDENGDAVKGINFTQCIRDHAQYADEATGLYPLTKELEYILKTVGEAKRWWNPEPFASGEDNYLFVNNDGSKDTVNQEIAWLFNCCYIVE